MQAVIHNYDRQELATAPLRGGAGFLVLLLHVAAIAWLLVQGSGLVQPKSEQTLMVMMIPPPEQPVATPQAPPPLPPETPAIIKSTRTIESAPAAPVVPPEPVVTPPVDVPVAEPVAAAPVAEPTQPAAPSVPMLSTANVRMAYLNNKMVYPDHLRRRGVQGKAVLKVLVSPEGRVLQVEVLRSSGSTELDSAAMKGVRDWKFAAFAAPGAVPSSAIVPIKFELK